eukprot:9481339-Pyramimonas_sp.AAC.2
MIVDEQWMIEGGTRVMIKQNRLHITGDYYGSEKSLTMPKADKLKIEFVGADGSSKVLKEFSAQVRHPSLSRFDEAHPAILRTAFWIHTR